jgi:hypothetical protein
LYFARKKALFPGYDIPLQPLTPCDPKPSSRTGRPFSGKFFCGKEDEPLKNTVFFKRK